MVRRLSRAGSVAPSCWPSGRPPPPIRSHCARLQIRAIRQDPAFAGGDYYGTGARPVDGLAIARGIGQVSYRTAGGFESRFGRRAQAEEDPLKGGRYAVESYLEHHGDKLAGALRRRIPTSC